MGTNANIKGARQISVDVEVLEQMEAQQKEIAQLRAQLAEMEELETTLYKLMRSGEQRGVGKADEEIKELHSQLARCVMYLKSIDDAHLQTIACKVALHSILEDLPKQAKADAEVLRLYHDHNDNSCCPCECDFCEAVRAAKKEK